MPTHIRTLAFCVYLTVGINQAGASTMAKYVLGWILGVPVIVLVIVYLLFN
jgi:hypothetical protein